MTVSSRIWNIVFYSLVLMLLAHLLPVVSASDPALKWDVLDPNATERWIEYEEYINDSIYDSPLDSATLPKSVLNDFPKTSHAAWNQESCGNCWVWASTAVLTQSYKLYSGRSVPLSIQFFNSNYNNGNSSGTPPFEWACDGGGADAFAREYNAGLNQSYPGQPFVLPWSNQNASWGDAEGGLKTQIPKDTINNTPNFGFSEITVLRVIGETEPDQAKAINNLTSVIAEGKVIGFAIGWVDKTNITYNATRFQNDFNSTPFDSPPYDPSVQNGMTQKNREGHEMAIIGYNMTDPDKANWYWIVQNSWGTTDGRPNGTIKFKMDMNYNATYFDTVDGKVYQPPIMAFWTFNVTWKTDPTVTNITPSSWKNHGDVNITDLYGTGFVDGAVVNLTKTGQPDITSAGYVTVISPQKITAWFNLTNAAVGIWDVVVTNPDGRSGTRANSFTITKAPQAPVVSYTYTPVAIGINDTVSFDASGSFDPNPGGIIQYEWNFGDGNVTSNSTASPASITHVYHRSQVYDVTLTVTNADQLTNSTMQQVQVIAKGEQSNTSLNGSYVGLNANNQQMIEVNITNTPGTVTLPSADTMVINNPGNGWSRMKYVSSVNFVNESSGNVNLSSISQVVMTTEPITAILNQSTVGTVTTAITIPLNQLPTGVTITQNIVEGANESTRNAFQLAAEDNNLNVGAVAYTVQFQNTALINQNLTGAGDPVRLNLSVAHSWVIGNGGITKIRIMRFADDGTRQVLTTRYLGSSADAMTDFFEGDSPLGLSIFGVTSVSSSGGGGGGGSGSGDGGSATSVSVSGAARTETVNVGGGSAVTRAQVTGTGLGKNLVITSMPRSTLPATVPPSPTTVYQYMSITTSTITGTVSQATLDFSVPQSWLTDQGFTTGDIIMMHYADGQWQPLSTQFISQSGGTVFYRATTPGFSYFAIAYQKGGTNMGSGTPAPATLSPATTAGIPAFPASSKAPTIAPTAMRTVPAAPITVPETGMAFPTLIIGVIGAIAIIISAVLVRRWWIRRQNPALFRKFD